MKNKVVTYCYIMMCAVTVYIILLAILVYTNAGELSKLRYSNRENFVQVSNLDIRDVPLQYGKNSLYTDEYRKRLDDLMGEMIVFIEEVYGIKLHKVNYKIVITENDNMFVEGGYDNIILVIAKHKLQRDPTDYEVLLIHELFHILSCQDGVRTRIKEGSDECSYLSEGFTNYLTDKFLDYMGYTEMKRICPRSRYGYYLKMIQCIFLEESNEEKFARYYFLDDFSFNEEFNQRVRKEALLSPFYYPYENLDKHTVLLYSNNFDSKIDFLITYEIFAYYCASMEKNMKYEAEAYFLEIEKWANKNITGMKNFDYSYFHDVLYNRV